MNVEPLKLRFDDSIRKKAMQISTQTPLTLATNLKQNQISQHPNVFKDELEKANSTATNTNETQNVANLNELNLASESFFEDLANIYYDETNDLVESMEFMLVEKFLALATRGMNALNTDDIAKGFKYGSKQWEEIPKNEATNKALLKEMLEISQNELLIYSNNARLDEYRQREQAFAKDILNLFDRQI